MLKNLFSSIGKLFSTPVRAAVTTTTTASPLVIAMVLLIGPWEQTHPKPYLDPVGIPTACTGVTGPRITAAYNAGYTFTDEQCREIDAAAANEHWQSLKRLVLYKPLPVYTEAALISFHYNVGPTQFARSTLLRKLNAGDIVGACNELPRWVKAKGVTLRGLENRRYKGDNERISERELCLIGVDPSYRSPLFERLILKVIQ